MALDDYRPSVSYGDGRREAADALLLLVFSITLVQANPETNRRKRIILELLSLLRYRFLCDFSIYSVESSDGEEIELDPD